MANTEVLVVNLVKDEAQPLKPESVKPSWWQYHDGISNTIKFDVTLTYT